MRRGHMMLTELKKLAFWKSPRSSRHVLDNPEARVEEVIEATLPYSYRLNILQDRGTKGET